MSHIIFITSSPTSSSDTHHITTSISPSAKPMHRVERDLFNRSLSLNKSFVKLIRQLFFVIKVHLKCLSHLVGNRRQKLNFLQQIKILASFLARSPQCSTDMEGGGCFREPSCIFLVSGLFEVQFHLSCFLKKRRMHASN